MSVPQKTVTIALGERSYAVHIGSGELARVGQRLEALGPPRKVIVGTNPVVAERYAVPLVDSLTEAGFETHVETVEDGEAAKKLSTVERFCDAAIAAGLDRRSLVIALGGGVTGDLIGFAASALFRGVDFVQVPTTLVAMVDSSVGGKTGVNSSLGKNLIGAFWQPKLVAADLDVLRSLPPRELRCGMAEVIKHGCILDAAMFGRLERELGSGQGDGPYRLTDTLGMSAEMVSWCIERSCELKGGVVAADEQEDRQRMWLNYGHTFGHAMEQVCGYGVLHHGEAVAIGMVMAARLGVRRGDLEAATAERIEALLSAVGLPTRPPAGTDPSALLEAMQRDKKVRDGKLNLVLLHRLGEALVTGDTPPEMVREILRDATREA